MKRNIWKENLIKKYLVIYFNGKYIKDIYFIKKFLTIYKYSNHKWILDTIFLNRKLAFNGTILKRLPRKNKRGGRKIKFKKFKIFNNRKQRNSF